MKSSKTIDLERIKDKSLNCKSKSGLSPLVKLVSGVDFMKGLSPVSGADFTKGLSPVSGSNLRLLSQIIGTFYLSPCSQP